MQRILVDHARRKRAAKRGGATQQYSLDEGDRTVISDPDFILDIDEMLGKLAKEDSKSAAIARLRLFAGLSIDEAAEVLGLSRASAFREWAYARSWLTSARLSMSEEKRQPPSSTAD
jgi:RNA polymerase sigma factor (TIGR02999 family)